MTVKVGDIVNYTGSKQEWVRIKWKGCTVVKVDHFGIEVRNKNNNLKFLYHGAYEEVMKEKTDKELADRLRELTDERCQIIVDLKARGFTINSTALPEGGIVQTFASKIHSITRTRTESL